MDNIVFTGNFLRPSGHSFPWPSPWIRHRIHFGNRTVAHLRHRTWSSCTPPTGGTKRPTPLKSDNRQVLLLPPRPTETVASLGEGRAPYPREASSQFGSGLISSDAKCPASKWARPAIAIIAALSVQYWGEGT